jgi:hypothetical protein
VVEHRAEIAHVEPLAAAGAFHEMIGFGLSDAVGFPLSHDRTFGFKPSSSHLRVTSSTLSARHRNSAASSIELPDSRGAGPASIKFRMDHDDQARSRAF